MPWWRPLTSRSSPACTSLPDSSRWKPPPWTRHRGRPDGGLAEIADGDRVALTFTADDPADLAAVLSQALSDPVAAAGRASHARQALTRIYDWDLVAAETVGSYRVGGCLVRRRS